MRLTYSCFPMIINVDEVLSVMIEFQIEFPIETNLVAAICARQGTAEDPQRISASPQTG